MKFAFCLKKIIVHEVFFYKVPVSKQRQRHRKKEFHTFSSHHTKVQCQEPKKVINRKLLLSDPHWVWAPAGSCP